LELEDIAMLEETLMEWREAGQLEGVRKFLLHQMERRFGQVPQRVRQQVQAISSLQALEELGGRILFADSLQAMGLG
jgi:hypothetical protein